MLPYPQPEPVHKVVMWQTWSNLTFFHWRYPVSVMAAHIPAPLTIEQFDGSAWLGITPFLLKGLRFPLLPAVPWISQFPETNCRTYVKGPDGRSGIWFFSLDAARLPAVMGARFLYGLPYEWSRMRVRTTEHKVEYESDRHWPNLSATARFLIESGEPQKAGDIEIFLTARFRLYSFLRGQLIYANVEHVPWPLYTACAIRAEQTLTTAAGLPAPGSAPIVHFSPGVTVRVGPPHTC